MSEYQYYEFAAVDAPLTAEQQAELREQSSRATITASSFVNRYHWGDLKGNPVDWVERYFDAHVYWANWQTCRLLLRVPLDAFDRVMLQDFAELSSRSSRFVSSSAFTAAAKPGHWILDWTFSAESGEHERFAAEEGLGWMAQLLPLRDELLRGDARPLYLGWLARLGHDELEDDDPEPPLPAGLRTPTPAQAALADFLLIDPDLLAAAAEASPEPVGSQGADEAIDDWLKRQRPDTLHGVLRLLLQGRGQEAERGLRNRFNTWQREQRPAAAPQPRRTVAQIEQSREAARARRLERERQEKEAREAQRRAERAAKVLVPLAARADEAWAAIDRELQRATASAYDRALQAVRDLSDALTLAGREAEFRRGLERLMNVHGRRPAWVARLTKAGLVEA